MHTIFFEIWAYVYFKISTYIIAVEAHTAGANIIICYFKPATNRVSYYRGCQSLAGVSLSSNSLCTVANEEVWVIICIS